MLPLVEPLVSPVLLPLDVPVPLPLLVPLPARRCERLVALLPLRLEWLEAPDWRVLLDIEPEPADPLPELVEEPD